MKCLKMLGFAAVAAMSFMAFAAGSASATTLEVGSVTKNESVTLTLSLVSGTSAILSRTDGSLANSCTASHTHGYTLSPYTGTKVTGTWTGHLVFEKEAGAKPEDGMSFSSCERVVTVHDPGTFWIEHIAGTTDGWLYSENLIMTGSSPFGTLTCTTGAGTTIGRLTGKASGNARLDMNGVLNCGFLVPSASWKADYWLTSPGATGVSP